jgi:hypothetical protein
MPRRILSLLLPVLVAVMLPGTAVGAVSASLTWNASSDANVTGYNVYYGGASRQYTNSVPVGSVTNVVVGQLAENTVYFFSAKGHDAAGNESPFSNEAAFCGFTVSPTVCVQQLVLATNLTGDQLSFSLTCDAPAGADIDATNGVFSWSPGLDYASTTNVVTVLVTDSSNPGSSYSETLLITVSDYLELGLGSAVVQTSQSGSLPLIVTASDTLTNLETFLAWPADRLGTPTLSLLPPAVGGSVQAQNGGLVVDLKFPPGQTFPVATTVAQLNFQALPGQSSAFLNINANSLAGTKTDASGFSNVGAQPGEVVVVGNNPLMRCQSVAGVGRTLTLFGNPGANYQLQYTTNLVPPVVWQPVASHQQGNVTDSVTVDDSQPVIFYQLLQQ